MTGETKTCGRCQAVKPLAGFYSGLICRECSKKKTAEWKKANPEKARVSALRWASSEKGRAINRASAAKFYKENPYTHSHYSARPEVYRAKNKLTAERLTDCYVANGMGLSVRDAPKDLIQAKREQMQITRLLRELNKQLKETK